MPFVFLTPFFKTVNKAFAGILCTKRQRAHLASTLWHLPFRDPEQFVGRILAQNKILEQTKGDLLTEPTLSEVSISSTLSMIACRSAQDISRH